MQSDRVGREKLKEMLNTYQTWGQFQFLNWNWLFKKMELELRNFELELRNFELELINVVWIGIGQMQWSGIDIGIDKIKLTPCWYLH